MESNNPSSDSSSGEDDEDIPYMENAGNLVFPELRPDDLWVRFSLILFFYSRPRDSMDYAISKGADVVGKKQVPRGDNDASC